MHWLLLAPAFLQLTSNRDKTHFLPLLPTLNPPSLQHCLVLPCTPLQHSGVSALQEIFH